MRESNLIANASRGRVLVAFAAVYVIWGSTYLAIRVAIETLPPLLMAGTRFVLAGSLLYAWMRLRGAAPPQRAHWRSAAVVGGFLLLGGNGGVVWAEQRVPSGLTALLVATVPLWMALLGWWLGHERRPNRRVTAGLFLGLLGVGLLVAARGVGDPTGVDPVGAVVLVGAALSWAYGSLWSRHAELPRSPFLATAMEMIAGGALLLLASGVRGEWSGFDPRAVSVRSFVAVAYLLVFGSLLGFTAYIYLLRATTPTRVATYAFVNPAVAVVLGWLVAGEALTHRTAGAAAVILTGVVLLVTASMRMPRLGGDRAKAPVLAACLEPDAMPVPSGALSPDAATPRARRWLARLRSVASSPETRRGAAGSSPAPCPDHAPD
jgi:drug/metabolite transporter (DMT)-like permease